MFMIKKMPKSLELDYVVDCDKENYADEETIANISPGRFRRVANIKSYFRWRPTSAELLATAERRILSRLRTPYTGRSVNIGPVVGSHDNEIWTICLNEDQMSEEIPLVLLHGLGAGICFWSLNLDTFAQNRTVYAIDLLGFGRSSRPKFSLDPAKAEKEFVESLEAWRKRMNLKKFIIAGHSFGGYLATSYSISYPDCVAHLILADPWGFTERPANHLRPLPWYYRSLVYISQATNPFWVIRAAGPKGPQLVQRVRPDIINKFAELCEDGDDVKFGEYIYHCNAQDPSGEIAFHSLMYDYGWSKFPLMHRLSNLAKDIDITAIYGTVSKIHVIPADVFQELRQGSYVKVVSLEGAGHHVYSDAKEEFNELILEACARANKKA